MKRNTTPDTWSRVKEDGQKVITEGSAELLYDEETFYNPIQVVWLI